MNFDDDVASNVAGEVYHGAEEGISAEEQPADNVKKDVVITNQFHNTDLHSDTSSLHSEDSGPQEKNQDLYAINSIENSNVNSNENSDQNSEQNSDQNSITFSWSDIEEEEPPVSDVLQSDENGQNLSEEGQEDLLKHIFTKVASVRAATNASHATGEAFFNLMFELKPCLSRMTESRSYKTCRRYTESQIPPVYISHYFIRDGVEGEQKHCGTTYPKKKLSNREDLSMTKVWSFIKLEDALLFDERSHGNEETHQYPWKKNSGSEKVGLIISFDGIKLDNSSDQKLELLSVMRRDCNRVLPIAVRIARKQSESHEEIFQRLFRDIDELNVKVDLILADSKARSVLLNLIGITGYYACSHCESQGVQNKGEVAGNGQVKKKTGGSVVWPACTMNALKRTHENWLQNAERADASGRAVKGIRGRSIILDYVDDIIKQVPIDNFHVTYLGIAKRLVNKLLQLRSHGGPSASAREVLERMNKLLKETKFPSEFQRDPRDFNEARFKASEWKNLVVATFPALYQPLHDMGQKSYAKLWLYFVYLTLGMLQDNDTYNRLKNTLKLRNVMEKFYRLYEKEFGQGACAPNLHLYYHLLDQREHLSLARCSTEPFEAFYALVRESYRANTGSLGKQILQNVYLTYAGRCDTHRCKKEKTLRPKLKDRKNDSYIYTKKGWFKIIKKLGHSKYQCIRVKTALFRPQECPLLRFEHVGVYIFRCHLNEEVCVKRTSVLMKGVRCAKFITAIPMDALFG